MALPQVVLAHEEKYAIALAASPQLLETCAPWVPVIQGLIGKTAISPGTIQHCQNASLHEETLEAGFHIKYKTGERCRKFDGSKGTGIQGRD